MCPLPPLPNQNRVKKAASGHKNLIRKQINYFSAQNCDTQSGIRREGEGIVFHKGERNVKQREGSIGKDERKCKKVSL